MLVIHLFIAFLYLRIQSISLQPIHELDYASFQKPSVDVYFLRIYRMVKRTIPIKISEMKPPPVVKSAEISGKFEKQQFHRMHDPTSSYGSKVVHEADTPVSAHVHKLPDLNKKDGNQNTHNVPSGRSSFDEEKVENILRGEKLSSDIEQSKLKIIMVTFSTKVKELWKKLTKLFTSKEGNTVGKFKHNKNYDKKAARERIRAEAERRKEEAAAGVNALTLFKLSADHLILRFIAENGINIREPRGATKPPHSAQT